MKLPDKPAHASPAPTLFRGVPLRPYNVGSGEGGSIAALVWRGAEAFTPMPEIPLANRNQAYDPASKPPPEYPAARYVLEVTRARDELPLANCIPLADAIGRRRDWHTEPKFRGVF